MSGKFYNLDTDGTLGGQNPADIIVSSQKAVRTYVDGEIDSVNDKIDAIEIVDELAELQDTDIKSVANGQALVYNETTGKWENKAITTDAAAWGNISGNISDQTDLTTALNNKANKSHTHTSSQITDLTIPTKVSDLQNDSGFIDETALEGYVQDTRKINNKPLSADVTLSSSDIGAQTAITSTNKLSSDLVDDTNKTHKFVTNAQMSTWNNKQDAISDLGDIRTGAGKGATAIQPGDNISRLVNDAGYLTESDIPAVMTYKGTVPTQEDLPASGNKKGDVYTVVDNGAEYVWNSTAWEYLGQLLDLDGYVTEDELSNYVPNTRKINNKTLTSNITLSASDVNAHPTITSTNKLSADLLSEGTNNKLVSQTEKNTWSGKQNALSAKQLADITAGGTALQPGDDISELNNDAGYITGVTWNDVTDKPTTFTPSTHNHTSSQITDLATTISTAIAGKANTEDLADVATSGSYNDLSDKPTIPTVGNAEIEIQKNGTKVDSFTTNQSGSKKTINITVPTNNNQLTNGAGYITSSALPISLSELTDDLGSNPTHTHSQYLTTHQDISGKANASEVYTKSEIDGKLASGMHYKGTKASASALPTTGNQTGDLWNVTDTGANYAWDGTKWDKLSENVDLSGLVPKTRTVNGKALSSDITLTYTDVSAASSSHTHSNYVTTGRKINNKQLSADVTLSASDVGAATSDHTHSYSDVGAASAAHTHSAYNFTAGTGLSLSGTVFNHTNSVTSGTVGTSSATSGSTLAVPYVTYDAQGHIKATGTHTHTVSGFVPTSRKVAGKALSSDITLSASDVGASATGHTHTKSEITDFPTIPTITDTYSATSSNGMSGKAVASAISGITYSDVGAASSSHTHSNYAASDHSHATNKITALTGYTIATTAAAIASTDSLNTALGKLQKSIDGKQASGSYVPTSRTVAGKALTGNITLSASDVGALPDDTVIPAAVTETTVSGWGFTKNTGTITGIKMNGASKGTSGVVDLGTVLTAHQTVKVNGVTGATTNNFGTCSTAAGTAAKAVTLTAGTFALETGARVLVKFTVTNTAANPTLNVGGTGAKAIQYRGSAISAGYLAANRTYEFVYDGTNYQLVGDINTDTNNVTAQNISTANDTYPILLGNTANATANIGNKATLFGSGIKANPSTSTIVATTFQGNATSATTASKLGTADKGSATQPIYLEDGVPTACTYTLAKSVPSDAKFTDTVYTHPTTSGNKHIPSGGSSGQFLKWSADGTATWAADNDTKNTAGSTDTSSKIFLVGATSQAANPQTYSHNTVFVDTDGALNSVTPASGNNSTKVATTAFVTTAIGSYVKKAGDTMTGALNFANGTWNKMGDDAYIGDHNIGGHICIKPVNSAHDNDGGITFFNSSDTQLVALKASSGTLTSSGALGLSNNAAKMQYNSTTEAIEFIFA